MTHRDLGTSLNNLAVSRQRKWDRKGPRVKRQLRGLREWDPTPSNESDAGIIFGMGLAGALIGFAVGTVVADVPPDEVIYQAPGYNTWVLLADKWKRP